MVATWDSERKVTADHILPYVDADNEETPEGVRTALHTLPFERNIFKLLANSPTFMPKFMQLLGACFSPEKSIPPADWQLAVLLTSRILDAPYEWDVNWPVAAILPSFQPVDTIKPLILARDLSNTALFTDRQRLIADFCEQVHGPQNRVSEKTMLAMRDGGIDASQITELFLITGIYGTLARFMTSANIDFDEPIPGLEDMLRKTFQKDIERDEHSRAEKH
ncbi:hypothetical protein FH972_022386 [Carpinus fangiana]|uniref:Carboxymuconolactone decarboxylase-like domain-containing protein n=1 Tax=Carpinus fangiana TaxID=176857 RepID=A0A5N6KS45_9ROSI|nr:hypothetical protein FH972_022386 [Carpinus fangiana]